jgi:outer membrane protein TolC
MAESQFLPSVALTASRSFYAYSDEFWIDRGEFEAYNSVGLAVQLPLFSGGSRWNDLKQAVYSQKKLAVMEELTIDQVQLEAEQAYYQYVKSRDNLKSYKEALRAAEESLRLADLYYQEGLSTQTEILNAQLAYTQNNLALKSGIYEYNTSQIALLRAIGDLERIWQE